MTVNKIVNMTRIILTAFSIIVLIFNAKSQEAQFPKKLLEKREIMDCELISLNAADIIASYYNNNKIDSINPILEHLGTSCGSTEWALRIQIINAILNNQGSVELIQSYFENNFHYVFRNRISNAKLENFGYAFQNKKSYYGFVPLRHPIDIATMGIATRLLRRENLTKDERLICNLFSEDFKTFDSEIYSKSNDDSFVSNYIKDAVREWRNSWPATIIYTGLYTPIGKSNIFSNSPLIGISFSTPISFKLSLEFAMKFRININDKDFEFFALDRMHTVNSDVSVFLGGLLGYKIFENKKLIVIPKFGAGLEDVSTGISEIGVNENDTKYHNIRTIHFSLGISALTPILKRQYIGFELSYHYTPYHLVENLHTKFDNNSLSGQLFFRF